MTDELRWAPIWEDVIVLKAHARWHSEESEDSWALSAMVMEFEGGSRLIITGNLDIKEGSHRVSVTLGVGTGYLTSEIAEQLTAERRKDIAMAYANDLLHSSAMNTAMAAGALVGAAVKRRWAPPAPAWSDTPTGD